MPIYTDQKINRTCYDDNQEGKADLIKFLDPIIDLDINLSIKTYKINGDHKIICILGEIVLPII